MTGTPDTFFDKENKKACDETNTAAKHELTASQRRYLPLKRAIDIVLSGSAIVVLLPVFCLISVAIKLNSPGPILFRQKRVGKNKEFFEIWKFRSMRTDTPKDIPTHMLDNPDAFITKTGRFLRKTSLDELPQIFNILRGQMSIIGPRPALWNQDDLVAERDKYGANDVTPGLTGWAQINGRDELEIPVKAKYDGEYVRKMSLRMDIKCFLGSIRSVLSHDGIVEGGTGELHKEGGKTAEKILVICQYYYPEPFRITDICEELVRLGKDVTVVTGTPNYPMGEIYPGYEDGKRAEEVRNGVKVHRCKTIPRKTGTINRMKNYFSYPYESKKYIKSLPEDFDVVFVNQLSPVMMAEAGIAYAKKHNKKLVLYCLDLWPESLCAGGISSNSVIYKVFERISRRVYRSADEIFVTSRLFMERLADEFEIAEEKMTYLPQYAEAQFLKLEPKEPEETFHLVFAGNIGAAQSLDTMIEAAKILADQKEYVFHIVGDGTEIESVQHKAEEYGLENVIFHGRKPLEDMPKYYEMADAMIVTLMNDTVLSHTLPGKVQTYMAAGKPIVGAINGETALVLEESQGGYCGKAEDSIALAENIVRLKESGKAAEIGKKNREYYERMFSKESFMGILGNVLKK